MSDQPAQAPAVSGENIPPALEAPRRRRTRPASPEVSEPAVSPVPPAAVPADIVSEDQHMATTFDSAADAAKTAQDQGVHQANAMFSDANGRMQSAMERGSKMFQELGQFNKGNLDALVESGRIAAKGMETMGQGAADYARKSFEGAQEAARAMATVTSPTDLMRLQGEFARTAFDRMVAEASRSTETMLKLAGEVAQPLSNRVAVAADKIKAA